MVEEQGGCFTLRESGLFRPSTGLPFEERVVSIALDFASLVERTAPHWVVLENIFVGKNPHSSFVLAHLRGALLLETRRRSLPFLSLTPGEVKKIVTGYGRAEKEQVQKALAFFFPTPLTFQRADESDAVAIALASFFHPSTSPVC